MKKKLMNLLIVIHLIMLSVQFMPLVIKNFMTALFFKDKTKQQAHLEFFKETLECVKTFDCFNCLGHLDYISRYGPYQNSLVDHHIYQEIMKFLRY